MTAKPFPRAAGALLLTLGLALGAQDARAGTAREQLEHFLKDVKTLRADFEQTLLGSTGGGAPEHSGGLLLLLRPGKFRWDYRRPYEQLILGDGENVWIYDKDLDQVTVKAQDSALGDTPALLLSGATPLEDSFLVSETTERGQDWVVLRPKNPDSTFRLVRLAFQDNVLTRMEMLDSFDQLTRFRFLNAKVNVPLPAELLRFTPPPGVDVIRDGE